MLLKKPYTTTIYLQETNVIAIIPSLLSLMLQYNSRYHIKNLFATPTNNVKNGKKLYFVVLKNIPEVPSVKHEPHCGKHLVVQGCAIFDSIRYTVEASNSFTRHTSIYPPGANDTGT